MTKMVIQEILKIIASHDTMIGVTRTGSHGHIIMTGMNKTMRELKTIGITMLANIFCHQCNKGMNLANSRNHQVCPTRWDQTMQTRIGADL